VGAALPNDAAIPDGAGAVRRPPTPPQRRSAPLASTTPNIEIVLQPIVELTTGATYAMEALTRFPGARQRDAGEVFAEAHAAGHGPQLELACLRAALARRPDLPQGVRMAVNLSPDVLNLPELTDVIDDDLIGDRDGSLDGVVIEVTEHAASDPDKLRDQFANLRLRGAAIAVDDVGTGYAGLLRLATMRPDFVKIDRTIVTGARDSASQQAVLEALVTFAHGIGAVTIGEGVESLEDLVVLSEFDVDYAQGWAIGKPASVSRPVSRLVAATCRRTRRPVLQRRASGGSASATFGMHAATSVLSEASGLGELQDAMSLASVELDIDVVSISVVRADGSLREIASSFPELDTAVYKLSDYPATRMALETGNTVEAHLSDPATDRTERLLMSAFGFASLLMIPVWIDDQPLGLLEFAHRSPRRWTSQDIAHGRGLARHLSLALPRLLMLTS
jgi:EAL domain-containing protein (putative c-di-GMP-specific phosphodiesterase class I)